MFAVDFSVLRRPRLAFRDLRVFDGMTGQIGKLADLLELIMEEVYSVVPSEFPFGSLRGINASQPSGSGQEVWRCSDQVRAAGDERKLAKIRKSEVVIDFSWKNKSIDCQRFLRGRKSLSHCTNKFRVSKKLKILNSFLNVHDGRRQTEEEEEIVRRVN